MSLRLKLKPHEKIIIGNTVIENGQKSASFLVHNKTTILREKDILTDETANSPARKIYFIVQLMYMSDSLEDNRQLHAEFFKLSKDFMTACPSEEAITLASDIGDRILADDLYGALKFCTKLIAYETRVMGVQDLGAEK